MNKYEGIIELIVRIVIKRQDKVLLCINKKTGAYFLPGGHVEFGDSLEDTIYKEMGEELGWKREDIGRITHIGHLENSYSYKDGLETHHELNMIFGAEVKDDLEVVSQEDHINFEWVKVSEIPKINLLPTPISQFIK